MYTIIGATGHVGGIVAETLLQKGIQVRVVLRHNKHAELWKEKGAEVALADLFDPDSLTEAFNESKAVFLMTPPGFDLDDPISEHVFMLQNISIALKEANLRK